MMANYVIEKLSANNYDSWQKDIKFVLMEKGLWSIIDKSEKEPVPLSASSKVTVSGKDSGPEISQEAIDLKFQKELRDFKTKSNMALSILYLNIDSHYRKIIENCDDPVVAWTELKNYYKPDTRTFQMETFSSLCNSRIEPGESVSLFSARLSRIGDQLRAIDPSFSEDYVSFQLIRFLPQCFDQVVQTILRWSKEDFKFKDITQALVSEEVRLQLRETDISALTLKTVRNKRTIICHRCQQKGHFQNQCPQLQRTSFQRSSSRAFRSPSPQRSSSRGFRTPSPSPERYTHRNNQQRDVHSQWSQQSSRQNQWGQRSSFQNRNSRGRNFNYRGRYFNSRGSRVSPTRFEGNDDNCKSVFSSYFISAFVNENNAGSDWVFDTGASHHFCNNQDYFLNFTPLQNEQMAVAINDVAFPIEGKGTVRLRFGQRCIDLKEVMYSPQLRRNLISGPRMDQGGATFSGHKGEVKVSQFGKTIFKAFLKNGLYCTTPKIVNNPSKHVTFAYNTKVNEKLELWHKRLSHICPTVLDRTCKTEGVIGLPNLKISKLNCEPCRLNKHRKVSFKPISRIRSIAPLQLLYSDVWGPAPVRGRNGEKFFVSVIDDFSRKAAIYPMKEKSEVCEILKRHIIRVENFLDRKIKTFRTDNGGEYTSRILENFFKSKGIEHEFTNPYTPQQNGVAERFNQTVANGACTILNESGLHESFWPEAMNYFTYTWNRLCHANQTKTPFELFGGFKPSVRHLRPFGIVSYVGIPRENRTKLQPKAKKGYLVGYAFKTRGYRIWVPDSNKIVETINVTFDETKTYKAENSSGAMPGPETEKFDHGNFTEFYFPSNSSSDYLRENLVEENTNEIPPNSQRSPPASETSDSESESESELKTVSWQRKAKMRSDQKRRDIYYYEDGTNNRLRSLREVKNYCKQKKLVFKPDLFDFSINNSYEGIVQPSANSTIGGGSKTFLTEENCKTYLNESS